MPRINLNYDGELYDNDPQHPPIRQITALPTKRKSRVWRYLTFWFLPLTSAVGVEVALIVVGPVVVMILIALFSLSPF